jgi:integrase
VGKNRFRVRKIPLNRAHTLGAISPDHYLLPRRVGGKLYDPTKPPSRWAWRTAWRKLTEEAGIEGLRPHDLRHHAITKLAESPEASEQTIMAIAGHVTQEMLEHYSHIRQKAKRKAVEALDNVTITSQLANWEGAAKKRKEEKSAQTIRNKWSGRADLNCRPLAPQASALPG